MTRPKFYYCHGTEYLISIKLGDTVYGLGGNGPINRWVKGINNDFIYWGNFADDVFPFMLDQTLWEPHPITYAASTIGIGISIESAVSEIIADIKSSPIGTPWAAGGMSQGACVASRIYQETRSGQLVDRRHDARAFIGFGNPMREINKTFPGGFGWSGALDIPGAPNGPHSTTNGHGAFPSLDSLSPADLFINRFARLQNTEDHFWNFAMPNDVFTSVGDSPVGQFIQLGTREGLRIIPIGAVLAILAGWFTTLAENAIAPFGVAQNSNKEVLVTDPKLGTTSVAPGGGHGMYAWFPPPNADGSIPSSGDTCYQLAAKYINRVGQQIYDELNPQPPNPANPAVYSWSSTW